MVAQLLSVLLGVSLCHNANANYVDTSLHPSQRAHDLLQQLTWEEKIGQMGGIRAAFTSVNGSVTFNRTTFNQIRLHENGQIGYGQQANWARDVLPRMNQLRSEQINGSRLHIPYIVIADSVNGLWISGGTLFPGTSSMASSWNLPLYDQVVRASRDENMAMGIKWVLSPEVDLAKDPRNGRNGEMYGEDGYLVGEFATQYIKAMQEKDDHGFVKVATTIKHFVYGSGSGGINLASMAGGINHILNDLGLPYQKAIKDAQPLSLMASYSAVDGVPMSVNKYLLQNVLRNILGFKGLIMSDASAIELLVSTHKVASSRGDAARKALLAGLEHELKPGGGGNFVELASMGNDEEVVALVDASVRAFLEIKFATGVFDLPLPTVDDMQSTLRNPRHLEINRNISRESIVMLKNEDAFLPRVKNNISSTGKIAVLGPYANVLNAGNYAPANPDDPRYGDTFLRSFQKRLGEENVLYAQGTSTVLPNYNTNAQQQDDAAIARAVEKAKEAGLAIVILGSGYGNFMPNTINNDRTDTEGWSHPDLGFPGAQQPLLDAILATNVPTILVMSSGQMFPISNSTSDRCKAIFHTWLAGEYTGASFVEIFLGETNPSGKLTVTIPEHNGAFPINYDYLPSDAAGGFGNASTYDWHWPRITRKAPLAFGYGLSYTTFSISSVDVSAKNANTNNTSALSTTVTAQALLFNTGNLSGKEVLQLYFRPHVSIIERPVMKLIRFTKVQLQPGQEMLVKFEDISIEELGFFVGGEWVVERGNYSFWVGTSSREKDLERVDVIL